MVVEGVMLMGFFAAQMSISSDGVNMLKIVGTQNGRIFAAGKDGNVYEVSLMLVWRVLMWARLSTMLRIAGSPGGVE